MVIKVVSIWRRTKVIIQIHQRDLLDGRWSTVGVLVALLLLLIFRRAFSTDRFVVLLAAVVPVAQSRDHLSVEEVQHIHRCGWLVTDSVEYVHRIGCRVHVVSHWLVVDLSSVVRVLFFLVHMLGDHVLHLVVDAGHCSLLFDSIVESVVLLLVHLVPGTGALRFEQRIHSLVDLFSLLLSL